MTLESHIWPTAVTDGLKRQLGVFLGTLSDSSESVTDYVVDLLYRIHDQVAVTMIVDEWNTLDKLLSERATVKSVVFRLSSQSLSGKTLDLEEELKSVKEILPRLHSKGLLVADIVVRYSLFSTLIGIDSLLPIARKHCHPIFGSGRLRR